MAVFNETQQVSVAEKQSELAWREAQRTRAEGRAQKRSYRTPIFIVSVAIGAVTIFLLLPHGGTAAPSLSTPSKDLPWRSVVIELG